VYCGAWRLQNPNSKIKVDVVGDISVRSTSDDVWISGPIGGDNLLIESHGKLLVVTSCTCLVGSVVQFLSPKGGDIYLSSFVQVRSWRESCALRRLCWRRWACGRRSVAESGVLRVVHRARET
jgi:hypothetical protein